MKNMSKSGKFLLICAIVFTLGLVMTIGGCVAGGPDGIKEAARKNGLTIDGEPAEIEVSESDFEFSSIQATGEADFEFVGSKYYNEVLSDHELGNIEAKAGKVIIISAKDRKAPAARTEGGTLVIDREKEEGIDISLSERLYEPTVIVFCEDKELESVSVSSDACDLEMKGVSFKTADIGMNAGDIDLKDVISGGIKIISDAGDVSISGVLRGMTDVGCDAGSVEINVFTGTKGYTMDLRADAGEIKVGEEETDGGEFRQDGGKDVIRVSTDAGDIEIGEL